MHHHSHERETPQRWQALAFHFKTRLFQLRRGFAETGRRPVAHGKARDLMDAPVIAEKRAPLWREVSEQEFPLTAGKVENLRIAARAFHGVEIPPEGVMSFWRQLGRTTRRKGYQSGRELREGCIVPAIGGGLCQLSGLLYQAALDAGLEIIERHGHSRVVPGSQAERDLDATVFWNYVDLRFRSHLPWRIEVELTATELVVRMRAQSGSPQHEASVPVRLAPPRALPSGDCLTCGMTGCFRHPSAVKENAPSLGHSAFLLDSRWPEFDRWCTEHSRPGDRWFTPMDGKKWRKPNYRWSAPQGCALRHATLAALRRSWNQRRIPAQGAGRQRVLLSGEAEIARAYARMIDPQCRHVVVSQNLLPHLWRLGVLGGRSFDVLMERWPMEELQRRLDVAKSTHPQSTTLGDFRADEDLLLAERDALAAAGRLVTPHLAIAAHFGERAWLIPWEMPAPMPRYDVAGKPTLFFPTSRLGRKGAFELAEALRSGIDAELVFLGAADEGAANRFVGLDCRRGKASDMASASALVLPAWIEHQPRMALLALASGIPVIATEACGLPPHENLHVIAKPDAATLAMVIRSVLHAPSSRRVA
jgi:glycosyltransferase involved in cell wall biosynthesis